ncbi:MAG: methylaspartate mutase subunit E [Blastocatellia bacterium]
MNSQKRNGHTILLGGLGGDSHFVGLTILHRSLVMSDFKVRFLGIQNKLEDFFSLASLCNAVLVSTMDGHAPYYLRKFPDLMRLYNAHQPLWYLGGNLVIGDGKGCEAEFMEMGFDRVFSGFVDITSVIKLLEQDLSEVEPIADCTKLWERANPSTHFFSSKLSDEPMELAELKKARREVLETWKTGYKARDLDENAEFLIAQPSFPKYQALVNSRRQPILLQPRSGVAGLIEQIHLFKAFKKTGIRVVSYQVDSLTRNNNYAGAEEAIRESNGTGVSTLNGFPVINHGVPGLRRVISEVKLPIQTRHSTRDPRLLAEISYAGGVTAFEGGAICYNIPYYKDYPLDQSIKTWQYVDRLTGLYYDRYQIVLDREFFGTLTATLIPPCIAAAVDILEAILAVSHGVKCVSLGIAEQGNRIQDIAAIRTVGQMAREILANLGYKDIQINTVFHQYMAAFPETPDRAEDLIYNSAVTAALSGATRVIIKTPVEAIKIPMLDDNLLGISLARRGIAESSRYQIDETRVADECQIIRREVQAIIDSVILCGAGSIADGIVKAFEKGYLDIPFAPSIYNRAEVMTARDVEGAVRFASIGNLQFDRELREFHEHKLQDRRRAEGLLSEKQSYILLEKDVMQIARGLYNGWPLA